MLLFGYHKEFIFQKEASLKDPKKITQNKNNLLYGSYIVFNGCSIR